MTAPDRFFPPAALETGAVPLGSLPIGARFTHYSEHITEHTPFRVMDHDATHTYVVEASGRVPFPHWLTVKSNAPVYRLTERG